MIDVKRAYEPEAPTDGKRILVERLWPRGMRKEALHLDDWNKDVAPSTELRKWFGHDPEKWEAFQERYFRELEQHPDAWKPLLAAARKEKVTLLFSARDAEHNNAVALLAFLARRGAPTKKRDGSRSRPKRAPEARARRTGRTR